MGFYGVAMPAATPRSIVERVSREIVKILRSPEVGGRFALVELDLQIDSAAVDESLGRASNNPAVQD